MTTYTQKIHLCMRQQYDWEAVPFGAKVWKPVLLTYKSADDEDCLFIREVEVAVDVPPDFNPVPAQVAALEAAKAKALAEYQKSVAEINERLSKLLCITNEVPA
jgi:hypothetical protein